VRVSGLIAFMTLGAVLSACGGGAHHAAAPPGSPQNPLVGKPTETTPSGRSNEGASQVAGQPGYQKLVERQSSKPASRFTPCNLVSRAQAQTILGGPVMAPVEAPQGPTCIYRSRTGKAFVTVAVQSNELKRVKHQLHGAQAVGVLDRNGYCGTYGQPMLYVGLPHKRVLSVAAPCSVAKRFAATAVARLAG
jgi:hypothetical protein